MNKSLLALFIFVSTFLHASTSDICDRSQTEIKSLLSSKTSRLSFKNSGGLIGGGVCWWHNRLQRSSAYLVEFDPLLPAPTENEVRNILQSLRLMNQTVVIPGYENFFTFSQDFKNEIQGMLEEWQRIDGFLNFEWIRGISGRSHLSPEKMLSQMDEIYTYFSKGPLPVWIMAQIRGITSHSLLIQDMVKTREGYVLNVIDSNHPLENVLISYTKGDKYLHGKNRKYSFVPYVGFQRDFKKIARTLSQECGSISRPVIFNDIKDGAIEVDY